MRLKLNGIFNFCSSEIHFNLYSFQWNFSCINSHTINKYEKCLAKLMCVNAQYIDGVEGFFFFFFFLKCIPIWSKSNISKSNDGHERKQIKKKNTSWMIPFILPMALLLFFHKYFFFKARFFVQQLVMHKTENKCPDSLLWHMCTIRWSIVHMSN